MTYGGETLRFRRLYFMSIVDTWICSMRHKYETLCLIKFFRLRTQFNCQIKALRSGNGTEFFFHSLEKRRKFFSSRFSVVLVHRCRKFEDGNKFKEFSCKKLHFKYFLGKYAIDITYETCILGANQEETPIEHNSNPRSNTLPTFTGEIHLSMAHF